MDGLTSTRYAYGLGDSESLRGQIRDAVITPLLTNLVVDHMPSIVKNADVEAALRAALQREGYTLSALRAYGENGVDIVASAGGEDWFIECIGYKSAGPARAKDFYESFFRVVSRLNEGASHLVIALSNRSEAGLPARAKHHGVAWKRIAQVFPELEIWLVDPDTQTYSRHRWASWIH